MSRFSVAVAKASAKYPVEFGRREAALLKEVNDNFVAATANIADKGVTAAKIALADGKVLIGGADGAAAAQSLSGAITINNTGVATLGSGVVALSKLATTIAPSHVLKFAVIGTSVTGTTLTGVLTDDIIVSVLADGTATVALAVADDTLPADPADTTWTFVLRATA